MRQKLISALPVVSFRYTLLPLSWLMSCDEEVRRLLLPHAQDMFACTPVRRYSCLIMVPFLQKRSIQQCARDKRWMERGGKATALPVPRYVFSFVYAVIVYSHRVQHTGNKTKRIRVHQRMDNNETKRARKAPTASRRHGFSCFSFFFRVCCKSPRKP